MTRGVCGDVCVCMEVHYGLPNNSLQWDDTVHYLNWKVRLFFAWFGWGQGQKKKEGNNGWDLEYLNYRNIKSHSTKIKLHASELMQKGCTSKECSGNSISLRKQESWHSHGEKRRRNGSLCQAHSLQIQATPSRERGSDSTDIQKKTKPQSSVVPALSQPDQAIVLVHRTVRSDEKDLWNFVLNFPF